MNAHSSVEPAIDRVSKLLNCQIGLRAEPNLRGRLERCIRDDAAANDLDVDAYADTLMRSGTALQKLVNRVTVQETSFFRHPEHFTLLASDILQGLPQPVTIWSAACSNGQEAYSLAMTLEERGIDGTVIASDLSTVALERTAAARYTERELAGLSPIRIARHLDRQGDVFEVKQSLRARVTTVHVNLLDPIPSQVYASQVVFCRNVLIYFSPVHARGFLERLSNALPDATLFLGAAESIWQLSDRYDTIRTGDTFTYCRQRPAIPSDEHRTEISRRIPAPFRSATTGRSDQARGLPGLRAAASAANVVPAKVQARRAGTERAGPDDNDVVSMSATLALAGQRASAAGDVAAAVVAFRKCAYLVPHDPMAHLNLGLALETAGDRASAQRAYAAARGAVNHTDGSRIEHGTEGYTTEDLLRFIHHKQQAVNP